MKTLLLLLTAGTLFSGVAFSADRDSSNVLLKKAKIARTEKRISMAMNLFKQSIEQDPTNAAAYKEMGEYAIETRNYRQAYLALTKWNQLEPENHNALLSLANINYMMSKYEEALTFAQKWENANPGATQDLLIGMCHYYLENFDQAITRLTVVASTQTEDASLQYAIGRSYVQQGQFEAALPFYQKATYIDRKNARYPYELAMVYYAIPDDKKSITYMEMAAQRGWVMNADYYENLAHAYLNTGNYSRAVDLLKISLEQRPYHVGATFALAEAYFKGNKFQDAIQQWDQVIQLDSKNARSVFMMGVAYQKLGQKDKGAILCDKAIGMDNSLRSLKQNLLEGGL
ncbi:MAG: tetratricopeptide repeat protein [Bacteroidetes bacterium]|nr:tetratricopeptide repeat protein [Bacteroidota bacterium]